MYLELKYQSYFNYKVYLFINKMALTKSNFLISDLLEARQQIDYELSKRVKLYNNIIKLTGLFDDKYTNNVKQYGSVISSTDLRHWFMRYVNDLITDYMQIHPSITRDQIIKLKNDQVVDMFLQIMLLLDMTIMTSYK